MVIFNIMSKYMPDYILFVHFLIITFYSEAACKLNNKYKIKYEIYYNYSQLDIGFKDSYNVSFICEVYKNNCEKIINTELQLIKECFIDFWLNNKKINSFVTSVYWHSKSKIKAYTHFSFGDLVDKISSLQSYSLCNLLEIENVTYPLTYLDPLLSTVFNKNINI